MLLEKYEPKTCADIIGNKGAINSVMEFVKNPGDKALLIIGSSGCGKSSCVRAVANELKYEIIEATPADFSDQLLMLKESGNQMSLFYQGKIILCDDVDSFTTVRGVSDVISGSRHPVILIASDLYANKVRDLKKKCVIVKFSKVRWDSISKFLQSICAKEGVGFDRTAIDHLSRTCGGDVRAALLDLEMLGDDITLEKAMELGYRERGENVFKTLQLLFSTTDYRNARTAIDNSELSPRDLFAWVSSNIPYKSVGEIANAYEHLSKADIYDSRIIRRQSWSLTKYVLSHTIGASVSGKFFGFMRYMPPRFWVKKDTTVLKKIGLRMHVSSKRAHMYVPIVKNFVKDEEFVRKFGFDKDDLKSLAKLS